MMGSMLFGFLLLHLVLGELAPLYTKPITVDNKEGVRSYIVVFTDEFPELSREQPKEAIKKWLSLELPSVDPAIVDAGYNIGNTFRGFAAYLNTAQLAEIRNHKYVKYVEEDSIATIEAFTDRQDWGQIRVNQRNRDLTTNNPQYTYNTGYPNQNLDNTVWDFNAGIQAPYKNDGDSAEVCIIDTGVRATHQEISGRVDAQINYTNDTNGFNDGNGHGTHVAGSCCGRYRGVAKNSRVVSAKALNNGGSGQWTWIISAIQWCANRNVGDRRTYIMSLSLGGGIQQSVNDAINAAASQSIPVVAAGNENGDACLRSPASAVEAITVMASDKDDNRASFSNYGRCADVWAPGVSIHSGWYTSDTAYNTISGTSMATPLVSGLLAFYSDDDATPPLTRQRAIHELRTIGTADAIKNCPANTANILAATGRT
jgi:subtilisin family serine protease